MPMRTFVLYTCLGAGIWSTILVAMGYLIGGNETLIQDNLPLVTAGVLGFVALTLVGYYLWRRRLAG
jgi:membrane protein DedA with SNARE-associated domain